MSARELGLLGVIGLAAAGPMPRAIDTEPLAVRGGVLMVPLAGGEPWPSRLELRDHRGRAFEALCVSIDRLPPPPSRRWTDDPRGLVVRPIETLSAGAAAYLLARLPADGAGAIHLGDQELAPRWHDVAPVASVGRAPMQLVEAPNRPDPDSPFEYWRWVILAGQLDRAPPSDAAYGELGSLVAEHYAGLWRLGLSRLERIDGDLADSCRVALCRIALDDQLALGAWVIEPAVVGQLLEALLDFDRRDRDVADAARSWLDLRQVMIVTVAPPDPRHAALAMINPAREPAIAQFRWPGERRVAAATPLLPARLTRLLIPRPAEPVSPGDVQLLEIDVAGASRRLTMPAASLEARPPGVELGPLRPPLTLAAAQSGWQRPERADRATIVDVRRLNGRWEVFFDCRRPAGAAGGGDVGSLLTAVGVEDTRGLEAVTLILGPQSPSVVLAVPETGPHRLLAGSPDAGLEVRRRSWSDRWYCRIILPPGWLPAEDQPLQAGFVRTHGDSRGAFETGPYATLPWRVEPGRAVIDLSGW